MRKKNHDPSAPIITMSSHMKPFRDSYFWLLTTSWPTLIGVLTSLFLLVNTLFATFYFWSDGIANVNHNDFWGYFFFSIHTSATVGYGNAYPVGFLSNGIVTVEIIAGVFMMALTTGLMFAKFSRPTAKVLFSKVAVMNTRDGHPYFSFRLANERGSHIAEAQLTVAVLKTVKTAEGETLRKLYDLKLDREKTPLFILSWTVLHKIDENSPLFGIDHQAFTEGDMQVIVSLTGLEPILGQNIHGRHIYRPEALAWGKRFKDALTRRENNTLHMDYEEFHKIY
jgi:inward rectifier potassium channel